MKFPDLRTQSNGNAYTKMMTQISSYLSENLDLNQQDIATVVAAKLYEQGN